MVRTKSLNQWPPASLPSHCRIDHGTIGYIHTEWPDEERCPVCRLQSELDAERAAHAETVNRCGLAELAVTQRDIELTALKAKLALAEAVYTAAANFLAPQRMGCTLEELRAGVVQMAHTQPDPRAAADTLALIDALAAWRAAK